MQFRDKDHVTVSLDDLQNRLAQVSYEGKLYHISNDDLKGIYDEGKSPTRAIFLVSACQRATFCQKESENESEDYKSKYYKGGKECLQGVVVRDEALMRGLAEAIRRDRSIGSEQLLRKRSADYIAAPGEGQFLRARRYSNRLYLGQSPETD